MLTHKFLYYHHCKSSQESFPHLFILTDAGTECTSIEAQLSHKRLDCRELHGCGLVDLMRFIARMPVKGITIPNWMFIIFIVYFKFLIFFVFVSLHDLNLMLGLAPTLDPASGGEILAGSGESQASREQTSLIRTISKPITQAARDYIIMEGGMRLFHSIPKI